MTPPRFPLPVFDPPDEEFPCVLFTLVENRLLLDIFAFFRVEDQSSSSSSSSITVISSSDDCLEKKQKYHKQCSNCRRGWGVEPPYLISPTPLPLVKIRPRGVEFQPPHLSFAEVAMLLDSHFLLMQFLKYLV